LDNTCLNHIYRKRINISGQVAIFKAGYTGVFINYLNRICHEYKGYNFFSFVFPWNSEFFFFLFSDTRAGYPFSDRRFALAGSVKDKYAGI